jgi:hypothetical protein
MALNLSSEFNMPFIFKGSLNLIVLAQYIATAALLDVLGEQTVDQLLKMFYS